METFRAAKEIPRFARNDNSCHSERSEESLSVSLGRAYQSRVQVVPIVGVPADDWGYLKPRSVLYQLRLQVVPIVGGDADATRSAFVASASRRRLKFVTLRVLCDILCVSEAVCLYMLYFFVEVINISHRRGRRRYTKRVRSVGVPPTIGTN